MKLSNNKGFTILELIVVLIVIGILVAFAAPKLIAVTQESKESGLDAAVMELNARENMCFAKKNIDGSVFATEEDLASAIITCTKAGAASVAASLGGSYTFDAEPASGLPSPQYIAITFKGETRTVDYYKATWDSPAVWK